MKIPSTLWLLSCLILSQSNAQICGADILHRQKLNTDSVYALETEMGIKALKKAAQIQKTGNVIASYFGMQSTVYTIPVVVHILHTGDLIGTAFNPSDAAIQGAIDYLNSVYNGTLSPEGVGDIGVQFALATRDPNNNPTNGIDRLSAVSIPGYVSYGVKLQTPNGPSETEIKNFARWDPGLYYNIYVVNKIDSKDGTSGTFVAGFARYPGYDVDNDGTVMLASQMKTDAKTLPHEIGHALGLAHPFENADDPTYTTCAINTNCSAQGDFICDTDPVTIPPFTVRTGPNPCNSNLPYNDNTEHNFMNYTNVFTLFTFEQKMRMLGAMTLPSRASLAASWATVGAYPYLFASPVSTTCTAVSGSPGTSGAYAGLLGVSVDNRKFSSDITAFDPGYVDKSNSPLYLIPLSHNASYSLSTDLFTFNYNQQVAAWIDYNNDGLFDNSTEQILYANYIGGAGDITTVSTFFSVPSSAVTNTVLRMRVIDELASNYNPDRPVITDACYDPIYGQAEDFPVYIVSTLPASWKYFRGSKTGSNVMLRWETRTINKKFDIERSVDGAVFVKIGTVTGSATSYTDHDAKLPSYFYRLVQTDMSDKNTQSSVLIVRDGQPQEDKAIRVKNPFKNSVDVVLEKGFASTSVMELIDLNGRRIAYKQLPAGQKVVKMEVGNKQLAAGVYVLKINSGAVVITKKLIKE